MNRVLSCPVWLSVLAVLAPRPVSANTAQLAAHLWKSDTLVMEPVLVRVEIRNDSRAPVAMVPPYMNCYQRGYWPLTLTVTGADGSAVPNGWEGGNGSEPVAYGTVWWMPRGGGGHATPAPRSPWRVDAHSTAYMWYDLTQFYPLESPGRYHITFHYRPDPEMLLGSAEDAEPLAAQLWVRDVDADAGWLTVTEPEGRDAEAAQWLLTKRTQGGGAVLSSDPLPLFGMVAEFSKRYPDTSYAPYAEFFRIYRGLIAMAAFPEEDAKLKAEADRFVGQWPTFPLNYRLRLAPLVGAWKSVTAACWPSLMAENGPWEAPERVRRAEAALRAALRDVQDLEFVQWVELELWQWTETCRRVRPNE